MGENYIPLVEGGLDLIGLDISGEAISQLRKRLPETTEQLVHGDLRTLPSGHTYAVVIGIQVFQHGSRREAHANVALAQRFVAPGASSASGSMPLEPTFGRLMMPSKSRPMEVSPSATWRDRRAASPSTSSPDRRFKTSLWTGTSNSL
jgi:hypothetical protein